MSASVERSQSQTPHDSTHEVIKIRRIVHIRNLGKLDRAAKTTLDNVRVLLAANAPELEAAYDSDYPSQVIAPIKKSISSMNELEPACSKCNVKVTVPCWCFVDQGTFLCDKCEENGMAGTHDLVRCQHIELDKDGAQSLEDRLVRLESRFVTVDDRLCNLGNKVETRLQNIEDMLRCISDK